MSFSWLCGFRGCLSASGTSDLVGTGFESRQRPIPDTFLVSFSFSLQLRALEGKLEASGNCLKSGGTPCPDFSAEHENARPAQPLNGRTIWGFVDAAELEDSLAETL